MFGLWFAGFLGIIIYRVFYAGMNSRKLFYIKVNSRYNGVTEEWDGEKVAGYVFITGILALTSILSLPAIAIFKIGKRFNKDAQ